MMSTPDEHRDQAADPFVIGLYADGSPLALSMGGQGATHYPGKSILPQLIEQAEAEQPHRAAGRAGSSTASPRDRFLILPRPIDVTLSVLPGHTVTVQVTYSDQLAAGACIECGDRVDYAVVSYVGRIIGELPYASYSQTLVVHVTCEEAWLTRVFPVSDPNSPALLADYQYRERIALELGSYAADQEAYDDSLPEDERRNLTGRYWASDALYDATRVIRFGYEPTAARVV